VAKLIILFVVAFVDMVGLVLVLPLLPYYATDLGASATMVGLLVAAFSVAQLAFAPVWGRMSDRLGRRPAILFGLAVTAVSYVVFAYARSVELLFLSRFVQGIGGGTIGVVQAYVADASRPEDRTKALGWLSAVTSLGAVAGPGLGSMLDAAFGRTAPGLAAAVLATGTALFAWRFLAESKGMRASGTFAAPAAGARTTGRKALARVLTHWREPAPRLIWIYAIGIGAFYGIGPVTPLLLAKRFAITEHTIGYIFMYFGGMGVVVRAGMLGPLVDRLREARLSRLGIVCLAAGLALCAVARTWPVLIAAITLMPLGAAFVFPCVTGLLSRVVPGAERGLYMGVQHTFGGVSRMAWPVAAGFAMDHFGMGVPFAAAAVLVALTLLLTGTLDGYLRQQQA
jgi:multidrug resistance protein